MQATSKQKHSSCSSCCQHKNTLCDSQITNLITLIKQRYISPYKIIYMINQKEADYFKLRNKGAGCCSSSLITIPKDDMTKTQKILSQVIEDCLKLNNLNVILEQLADKYDNIVKSGQKQNLKVDDQVEKFLVEKVFSQGFNLRIYKLVVQKLKNETQKISQSAMLWATPNTWYTKYPQTPLNFLSSQTLSNLNNQNKGFGIEKNFLYDFKDNLLKQLKLMEQDGKFEQQIWVKQNSHIRNDKKVLNSLQRYTFDGTQDSYRQGQITYPYLKKSLQTLKSIPFQLNAKLNAYCTISENNQVSYFKNSVIYKVKQSSQTCRYLTYCPILQGKIKCFIKNRKSESIIEQKCVQSGQLILIDNETSYVLLEGTGEHIFLFRSWISTLPKKN